MTKIKSSIKKEINFHFNSFIFGKAIILNELIGTNKQKIIE